MRTTRQVTRSFAALLVASGVSFVAASRAQALPRYSARYEQKCALCHVNPSGGGMRTSYASQKLVPEEIAWTRAKIAAIEEIEQKIPEPIQIGTDFREMYVGANIEEAHLNFFQMQADLYFAFQLDPRVTLYYDRGETGSYELFGIDYFLPTLYLKAGRFVPSYGWKFDDHSMFVRADLGFMPPANSDVGLEAGWSMGPFDLQAGIVNGNRGGIFDSDTKAAGVVNADVRRHLGPFGAAIGITGYHQPGRLRDYDSGGAYGYLTWNKITWVGEGDFFQEQLSGGPLVRGLVASHELTYLIRQGLELKATYDYLDPDRDLESGAKSRFGGGVFVMPRPYATMEALLRRTEYDDGPALSGVDFTETVLQLHLLY